MAVSLAGACALPEVRAYASSSADTTCEPPEDRPCELLSDCGCAEDQTCRSDGTPSGQTACGAVGSVLNFEPCERESDCARHSDCIGAVCKPYCSTDDDCGGLPGQCAEIATAQGSVKGVKVCSRGAPCDVPGGGACELISDCGCVGGQTCRVVAAVTGRTQCGAVGAARDFEACTRELDCAWGLDCIGGQCKPYCRSDADCSAEWSGSCAPIATASGEVAGASVCSGNAR